MRRVLSLVLILSLRQPALCLPAAARSSDYLNRSDVKALQERHELRSRSRPRPVQTAS